MTSGAVSPQSNRALVRTTCNGFQDVPIEMKKLDQWIVWREELNAKGKPTKIPYIAGTNTHASSTDPRTWRSFQIAVDAWRSGNYSGIGFCFEGSRMVGVDLDNVIDPADATIKDWAATLIRKISSYTEISPGRHGLHTYALGQLPGPGFRHEFPDGSAVEMYDAGRFFCVTGKIASVLPEEEARAAGDSVTFIATVQPYDFSRVAQVFSGREASRHAGERSGEQSERGGTRPTDRWPA